MKYILALLLCFSSYIHTFYEHPIVVVIPSRNNVTICRKNLASVFAQTYQNYRVIYIDDASDDGTYDAVCAYITECNQWHRVIVLKNDCRRGQMFNHFRAVHMCANYEIIVNLDGDDALLPDALEVINNAYQDKNTWMTYGQYREVPNGKHGHCKKVPDVVKRQHAYRYYDWVTSHPRTFYAGLFKQIPIGYFIHEGDFQPCAVDFAMMFPMLELSQGRIRFIEQVLYLYNCANPNNIFRNNVLQQLRMGYLSRGREPLSPLTFDPRESHIGDISESRAAVMIISENAPQDLKAFFEKWVQSGMQSQDMHVVYTASNSDMRMAYLDVLADSPPLYMHYVTEEVYLKKTLLNICTTSPCSHLLILSDKVDIVHPWDFSRCIQLLEKTHACGFYLNRGKDIFRSYKPINASMLPPLVQLESAVYVWKFKHASSGWKLVYTCDGVIYRMNDIKEKITLCDFNTINGLCNAWQLISSSKQEDVGICFEQTCIR